MLVAASPGGPTSNLLTYLFKGDVALNITLQPLTPSFQHYTLPLCQPTFFTDVLGTNIQPVDMPAMKMITSFFHHFNSSHAWVCFSGSQLPTN